MGMQQILFHLHARLLKLHDQTLHHDWWGTQCPSWAREREVKGTLEAEVMPFCLALLFVTVDGRDTVLGF